MAVDTQVSWNLDDLFAGVDDARIDGLLDDLGERVREFAERYRGKIDSPDLNADTLASAIRDYEAIVCDMAKPISYASLMFAADTSKPEHGIFMQRIQERQTQIQLDLLFFELELMAAKPEVIEPLLQHESLNNYRHFVQHARLFREHRLSESEERILEEKANTGGRAFERLFEETIPAIEFRVEIDGEEKVMTEPEVLALLREPNRETRRSAAAALTRGLDQNSRLLTFIYNTLILDKSIDDRLRRYDYPEQARHMANELDKQTVDTVMDVCVENYPLVARYYHVKREILGYDKLTHYDRYAPLFESKDTYTFDQARDIVLESFGRFSSTMAEVASEFFSHSWIDAAPRKGKRGGAFCAYMTPDLHPYVFLNYLNRKDDIMTLAHELGHGVHAYLARCQTYLNFSSSLPVAELASTFGEMLVFESLVAKSNLEEKLALYAEKIEECFATIFRQACMFRFEQEVHTARREMGELTKEEIGDIWQDQMQRMFGDSVELGDEHKLWWMYVGHFVSIPFYVYAYSFGELLVMALYSMYRRECESFVPKYLELLRTGGACSPSELLSRVGIDIKDREFWRGGMRVVEDMIADFERLYEEWKNEES